MQLAYYPGCSLQQSSALYDVQSRRIFSELGAELVEIEDWNCCGATSAGKVDDFMAIAMPARNIGIAEITFDRYGSSSSNRSIDVNVVTGAD